MNLCGDVLETERGERMVCSLPVNHEGPHESQDWEWWEGGPETRTAPGTRELMDRIRARNGIKISFKVAAEELTAWRIQDRIERHILSGPERESFALSEWRKEWEKVSSVIEEKYGK